MNNLIDFILTILIVMALAVLIIIITGITYNGKGYASVIEKKHDFYKIEIRKFSFYFPLLYHKVRYYPTIKGKLRLKRKTIYYQVVDIMKLYKTRKTVKEILLNENINLQTTEKEFGFKILDN